jgi:hypothetical protein
LQIMLRVIFGLWVATGVAGADDVRRTAFTFGLRTISYDYASVGDSHLTGTGGSVEFGYAWMGDHFFGYGSISSLAGPFDRVRRDRISLDFSGTGLTAIAGYAPLQGNIRADRISLSVLSGFNVTDMVGRSAGRVDIRDEQKVAASDQGEEPASLNRQISSFTMQVNEFSVLTGIGISWMDKARPYGNTPELLKTKMDGVLAIFAVSVPVAARYRSKYEQVLGSGPSESRKEQGRLSGVSLVFGLTTLIGV